MAKSKFPLMTYGARLQKALDASKKTRRQLADHLKTSPQRIGIIITWAGEEERLLTTKAHLEAARYLNVDPYWLATGEESDGSIKEDDSLGAQLGELFDLIPEDHPERSKVFTKCFQLIAPVAQRIGVKPIHTPDARTLPQKQGV